MFRKAAFYHRRTELHDVYGGSRQGGIAPCRNHPYIFLFTAPTGEEFGYKDGWVADHLYAYTGEGQVGDMQFVRGNRAIRDHQQTGKELHLFELHTKGIYKYIGKFKFVSFELHRGPDQRGHDRQVIRFYLTPEEMPEDPR